MHQAARRRSTDQYYTVFKGTPVLSVLLRVIKKESRMSAVHNSQPQNNPTTQQPNNPTTNQQRHDTTINNNTTQQSTMK